MNKKTKSILIIFIIYLLTILAGFLFYQFLQLEEVITKLLLVNLFMTFIIWILSLIIKNASLYDPYWSVIPPVLLLFVLIDLNMNLNFSIYLLMFSLSFWSIRLTYNWAVNWQNFNHIDWRYQKIKDKAPKLYFLTNLLAIQLFPTMIVFIQLIAAVHFINIKPDFNIIIMLGSMMMIISAVIQFISDAQMRSFKHRTKDISLCIEEGLWKYSRHPNYFGEVMVWWGLYIMYLGAIKQIDFLIISPIVMTSLFLFVSIPWMEKKIISTRPNYLDYQKRVSMLIPFFRKDDHQSSHVNEKP
jgi:steroid 5-alpha reductase family enzyme